MDAHLKNFHFTRWVYDVRYFGKVFIEFSLDQRIDINSTLKPERYELAIRTELEPFKKINSKTKGANLYFRSCFPHDPKDETALFPTQYENIFYGDIIYYSNNKRRKVLVFFQLVNDENRMIVDVFDEFYTKAPAERNKLLNWHPWYVKKAPLKSALKSFKTLMAFKK